MLSLWDLVYYGIILTSPIAAVPLFGEAQVLSHGHTVTTLLLAMVAMSVTAVSFGRMANVYPSSGSVYSYISKTLNPHVGFILGWAMFLEYLFQPIQNSLYAVLAIHRMVPQVPFALLAALTVGFITLMTVQGIKFTARTNEVLLGFMLLVTAVFLVQAFRHIVLHQTFSGLFSLRPIYNPATFNLRALAAGTSFAALVFIGFDGVSILAEEVKNPKRNVLLASVLVCVFTGLFSGLQVYLAQLVWPDHTTLQNPETAFMDVARIAGGPCSSRPMELCCWFPAWPAGSPDTSARRACLYSMGRDDVIPKKIFGHLSPKKGNPSLQRVDRRGSRLHRGTDDPLGAGGGDRNLRRVACIHGRQSCRRVAFLVFAGSRRAQKVLRRRVCPWFWRRILLRSADWPAIVDEICGLDLAW